MDLFSQTICLILSKSAFYSKKCNYLYLLPRSSCVLNFWTKYYSNFCYANNRFFSSFVCVVFYGKVTKIWHKLFHRMWNFFYTTQFLSKAYYMEYIGGSDHVQVECSWKYILDYKWIFRGKIGLDQPTKILFWNSLVHDPGPCVQIFVNVISYIPPAVYYKE